MAFNKTNRSICRWIFGNTKISTGHMTPEIKLRLITDQCPMWTQQPDQCPFADPYWAFYWPGGQTLARFLLDNKHLVDAKRCLDFGSGCGAAGIASILAGSKRVIFNDIDPVAQIAACINVKLNNLSMENVIFENANLLQLSVTSLQNMVDNFDTILVGDMFYDSEFGLELREFLKVLKNRHKKQVFLGDPGRHAFPTDNSLTLLAEYPLDPCITREHYGFSTGKIFSFS